MSEDVQREPGGDVPLLQAELRPGADRPTIFVAAQSYEGIRYLCSLLRRLESSSRGAAIRLEQDPNIRMKPSIRELRLEVATSKKRMRLSGRKGRFKWRGASYDWETARLVLEALEQGPGHQYLADELINDAVVEVSCGETKLRQAPDDWRRLGQERYLAGAVLVRRSYAPPRPGWDHDHCEFCGVTFSLYEADLSWGYATDDDYVRWICEGCFEDFKVEFEWTLREAP